MVDTIQLQSDDSIFVAQPMFLAIDEAGDFFVADAYLRKVLRFSRSGRIITTYGGTRGRADELHRPYAIGFLGDSLVAADDARSHRLFLYRKSNAQPVGYRDHLGFASSMLMRGDFVLFGELDYSARHAVTVWDRRVDSMRSIVAFPEPYLSSKRLAAFEVFVQIEKWGDTLLVGLGGYRPLMLYTNNQFDRPVLVDLPAIRRRGIPKDLAARFNDQSSTQSEMSWNSMLFALHRGPGGNLFVIHTDQDVRGKVITALGYVSQISSDLQTACIDTPLEFSQDAQPRVAFRGDTLFALQQRALPGQGVLAYITAYVLDTSQCTWTKLDSR